MFSPSEIDHVAWFLVVLIGALVLVNALVDLSSDDRFAGWRRKAVRQEHDTDD